MPPPKRLRPTDFAEMAKVMQTRALCEHYGAGPSQISRWRRETGLGGYGSGGMVARPVPDDFRPLAATESNAALAARYSVSVSTIGRWRRETGIPSTVLSHPTNPRKARRPIPSDFAKKAALYDSSALMRLYCATRRTVQKWREATGAYFVRPARPVREPRPRPVSFKRQAPPRRSPVIWKGPPAKALPPRDTTFEGQAAEVLRRVAPTHRCDERGRAGDNKAALRFWRFGNVVLTPDELLQRAAAKGWRAQV